MTSLLKKLTIPILLVVSLVFFLNIIPASAISPNQGTEEYCLSCHGEQDITMTFKDGESTSITISKEMLDHSIHSSKGIECVACHQTIQKYPHPVQNFASKRELSIAYYEACKACHSGNYEKAKDSIHASIMDTGNLATAICTDCHGAHDISAAMEPKSKISATCGKCHDEILATYTKSVHGAALINEGNQDVPVCTDCHGVHNIVDPRTVDFRVQSPEMCAKCHSDPELMGKYGLSSDVYSIYKTSWHGVDVSVYKAKWPTIWHDSAVCTDCHGIHDIGKPSDPNSMVSPQNLLSTCQKCHPGAGPNWTGAWTGHNKISLERTPILFYVDAFYSSFSPFVLWVCVIYVLLQIIRQLFDRVRRNLP